MRKQDQQGGWAALLPLGLVAILGTGGVVVATEQTAGVSDTGLVAMVKSDEKMREGKVTVEVLDAQLPSRNAPSADSGK